MRLLHVFILALICIAHTAFAQDDPVFLDVDRAFQEMQENGTSVDSVFAQYEDALSAGDNFNILVDGLELIRRPDIPVVLNVSGDWGDFTARCNLMFQFVRRTVSDGSFHIEGGVWGSSLEFAYPYAGEAPPDTITTLEEDYDTGSFGSYAAGDFLINPDCSLGRPDDPDFAENPRIAELQDAQLACADALVARVLVNPNGALPQVCVESTKLLASLGLDVGIDADFNTFFERCILEQSNSIIGGAEISEYCRAGLKRYADRMENALGLCDMEEIPTVELAVIDPRPEQFKARYLYDYQRSDCKFLRVAAYINAPPPELFTLTTVQPAPDACLAVDYVAPGFRVTFKEPIRDEDLDSKVLLELITDTAVTRVPVDVSLSGPNQIDISPRANLNPQSYYTLSLKTGINGLRSTDDAELEIDGAVVDTRTLLRSSFTPDFEPVTWFRTTPFSKFDTAEPPMSLRAGVYQVARDAELIRERPTATRIWLDWPVPAEPAPSRRPSFCAKFEVLNEATSTPLYEPVLQTMKPTDDYSDEERLNAEDTVNFFNWRPTPGVRQILVTAEPSQYWHAPDSTVAPPIITATHDVTVRYAAPVHLKMKFAYLRVADFEEGASAYEVAQMAHHMEAARLYTWQMGPFGRVSVENVGSVTPEALGVEIPWGTEGDTAATADTFASCARALVYDFEWGLRCENRYVLRAKKAVAMFRLASAAFAGQHCKGDPTTVCFLFVPPYLGTHQDVTTRHTGRGVMVSTTVLGLTSEFMPDSGKTTAQRMRYFGNGGDLAHEVGHSFGLYHVPFRKNPRVPNFWEETEPEDFRSFEAEGGRFRGIDGVRMHPSGNRGVFKSSEHGNPQNPSILAPLMFPQVLPTGSTHILNIHYNMWLRRLGLSSPVYSLGDPRFTDPDPDNPSQRVGLLVENTITYDEISSEIIPANIAIFDDLHAGDIDNRTRVIGYDPAAVEGYTDGIITALVALQGEGGTDIFPLTRPTRGTEKPVPTDGAQYTLTAFAGAQPIADVGFGLEDGVERTLSVFLPLIPADMQRVTQVVLRQSDGTAIVTHDIPALPANDSLALSETPDGLSLLTWDSAGTDASVTVSFEFEQDGQRVVRSIGSATDTGRFAFDPAMVGISGSGTLRLTFDNGLAFHTISLPATLNAPFARVSIGQQGPWDQPELIIGFNRAVTTALPAFTLMQDGVPVDIALAAVAVDDSLFLTPQAPLAPCTTYAIQTETPLLDVLDNPLRAGVDWTLDSANATDDCPRPQSASLLMRRDTRAQTSDGRPELTGDTIILRFDRQIVVLAPPSLRPGIYGLQSVGRGDTRQTVVLNFAAAGPDTGGDQLVLSQEGPTLTGTFAATLRGGKMEGRFEMVPE